jgi:hypothetical protein
MEAGLVFKCLRYRPNELAVVILPRKEVAPPPPLQSSAAAHAAQAEKEITNATSH